jgi:hypothetical protein
MGTVIGIVVGIAAGALVSFLIARRVIHRPTLLIKIEPSLVLSPGDLDVHGVLTLSLGGRKVQNICVLVLEVACRGQKDIVVTDAAPPRSATATPLPRIDFREFRIIGIRTTNNDLSRFYVPISRHSNGRGLYVNIHRLSAGTTARFQVVGELENSRKRFEAEQCEIFPGAIPDIKFATAGSIARQRLKT